MVVAFASALPGSVSAEATELKLHAARGGALLALAGCLVDNHGSVASHGWIRLDH